MSLAGEDCELRNWVQAEFGSVALPDKRLNARLKRIVWDRFSDSIGSIPQGCEDWAATKAAYRFLSNGRVEAQTMLQAHRLSTMSRVKEEPVVLVIGDTTLLDYSEHLQIEGMGPLNSRDSQGLMMHVTLAATPQGIPLGVVDNFMWARDPEEFGSSHAEKRLARPIAEKESQKWLRSLDSAEQLKEDAPSTQLISVFDREGDNYDVLMRAADPGCRTDFVIRSQHDRRIDHDSATLSKLLDERPVAGEFAIRVPRRPERKGLERSKGKKLKKDKGAVPPLAARDATLEVCFAKVTLLPSRRRCEGSESRTPIEVCVVRAREKDTPHVGDRIQWTLLTSLPVTNLDEAWTIVQYYTHRWLIELLFKVLKSGCKAEDKQFKKAERLERLITLDIVIAWRILYLTTAGREVPDLPCTVIFEEYEWTALWAFKNKTVEIPESPPTLREATRMVASLGPFLGRKSDGEPGVKSLWIGLHRLFDIAQMWVICRPD